MTKKFLVIPVAVAFFIFQTTFPLSASSKEKVQWKSTNPQWIQANKWTTLDFDNKKAITKLDRNRALYCAQVGLKYKKKPKYVKMRFARLLPNDSKDTTATNTWVMGKNSPKTFHGSMCWSISTKYPVVVQVKIGGTGQYQSHLRQFKAWSPSSDIPEDMLDYSSSGVSSSSSSTEGSTIKSFLAISAINRGFSILKS